MCVIGLGLDLVETRRLSRALERQGEAFVSRVFTPGEAAYCRSFRNPVPSFAARFAAKEAVAKALGTGIAQGVSWVEIEVRRHENGQPYLCLHGETARICAAKGVESWLLTLTHTENYAAASVIALGAPPGTDFLS